MLSTLKMFNFLLKKLNKTVILIKYFSSMGTKKIRPELNLEAKTDIEHFQNTVLRPVLKLQHSIIIGLFKYWALKHKLELQCLNLEGLQLMLKSSFSKNMTIKNQLIGIVIGQFTLQEFQIYSRNTSEYNKRLLNMIKKRLFDSFEELKNN